MAMPQRFPILYSNGNYYANQADYQFINFMVYDPATYTIYATTKSAKTD